MKDTETALLDIIKNLNSIINDLREEVLRLKGENAFLYEELHHVSGTQQEDDDTLNSPFKTLTIDNEEFRQKKQIETENATFKKLKRL